jgi:transposase
MRARLQLWSRQRGAPHALVQRVRIVLDAAAGEPCTRIAERHGVTVQTVSKWVRRFAEARH